MKARHAVMFCAAALVLGFAAGWAAGAEPYPAGTLTRIYAGDVSGEIGGITQTATAQGEITGTAEDFASTGTAHFVVRGQFVQAPLLAGALEGRWSNFIGVNATGWPFRAAAEWAAGDGLVLGLRAADWSTITLEATGTVAGIKARVNRTTLALVEVRTNRPAENTATNAAGGDSVALVPWTCLGKHKLDPGRIPATRTLYSAKNLGDEVSLSFEPLNWSAETGSNGKTVDGRVCIAWQEGAGWTGGHFDWHGRGQTRKTQGNIPGGYLDGKQPPKGAPVFYFITNREKTERTTIVPGGVW